MARRAFVYALAAGGVVVLALALWKLRLLIALLFLAFTLAAAMRPSIERLHARGIPRGFGIGIHYAVLSGLVALLLWAVIPRATDQVGDAIDTLPQTANDSGGIQRDVLVGLRHRLENVPSPDELVDPAVELGILGFEIAVGIFFTLASAAYWIFERNTAVRLVTSLLPRSRRKVVRDTWDLIDMKLGAYVRGQVLLIALIGTVLSLAFWAIGLPYWLLIGIFAGIVEIVPVIGPLAAGTLAVGIGLTESWQLALTAGIVVLVVRLLEDYLVIPRVLGNAVGLSPLLVLISMAGTALLFGEFAVLLAIPIAAVLATLFEVVLLSKDPAAADVPAVIFPAKEAETVETARR